MQFLKSGLQVVVSISQLGNSAKVSSTQVCLKPWWVQEVAVGHEKYLGFKGGKKEKKRKKNPTSQPHTEHLLHAQSCAGKLQKKCKTLKHLPNCSLGFFCGFFWLCWVFVAARRLSLVAVSGGYSSLQCVGFSLQWLLLWSTGSRLMGFSNCGTWAQ